MSCFVSKSKSSMHMFQQVWQRSPVCFMMVYSGCVRQLAIIFLMLEAASCASGKDASTDDGDSASEVDPCKEQLEIEPLFTLQTSGDKLALDTSDQHHCEPGVVCQDSYIVPTTTQIIYGAQAPRVYSDTILFITTDDTTQKSTITDEQRTYFRSSNSVRYSVSVWGPSTTLYPSTKYEVWRQYDDARKGESSLCFDFSLTTSPHGSPLSLPTTPLPVMQVRATSLYYLFDPERIISTIWPDGGGPDLAIQFGEMIDGQVSVRVAAVAATFDQAEQSWCHATLDSVVAVDQNGAFQIPGVPWRGAGSTFVDPSFGSDFQNLLVEPFTIKGHLAPDGQNAIVTFDDVLLDYRLSGDVCDWGDWPWFNSQCPDGEICCMDLSTGPTITEPSPLTSLEYIAQDNCHARCPTSADNPDCVLP